jgi:flagellar hook-associated protein 1 FlgK
MSGIYGTMDIAKQALNLTQTQIEVTGNNIANADTPGYSRRTVIVEENQPINTAPGQIGTGVSGTEIARIFDEFVERQYTQKLSEQEKWSSLSTHLQSVEMLFNENQEGRLNDVMAQFFKDWQDLSVRPDDANVRSALLGNTQSLLETLGLLAEDLQDLAGRMDGYIEQEVEDVNSIVKQIAALNNQISVSEQPGINANVAMDERDLKIRELAEKLDIHCIDNGGGKLTITTGGGQTLVDGDSYFLLDVQKPKAMTYLTEGSSFGTDGQIYFSGSSSYEYTIKVADDGGVDAVAPATQATFNVSLDGGVTWLKNDDGTLREFEASSYDHRISLPGGELQVWFGTQDDIHGVPTQDLKQGDMFTIVPKEGVYWSGGDIPTVNITTQIYNNGEANPSRITGGSLGGYLAFRDEYVGEYQERLNALARGLVWEVNAIHSQGSGLQAFTDVVGTYSVTTSDVALGTAGSGLAFADKLQTGNLVVSLHDDISGETSTSVLSFGGGTNFDPQQHSLEDVQAAFNAIDGLTATIENNTLKLQVDPGTSVSSFSFGQDSTGLLAALGINTFLAGEDASSLAVNPMVAGNLDYINAGQLDASGVMDSGSNAVAQDIAALQYTGIAFSTFSSETSNQTLQDYYTALVSKVGADTARSTFNLNYQQSLADDLKARQDAVSGVNLDEEMSNLIKFQQSYAAAAKLITTANQMFDTLLAMKN